MAEPGLLQVSMDWEMSENVLEFKLADVPELGYLTTDRPFPRGELLLKTHSQIKGYYKHAEVRCWGCSRAPHEPEALHRTKTRSLKRSACCHEQRVPFI